MALDKPAMVIGIKAVLVAANAASGSKDAVFQSYAEDLADVFEAYIASGLEDAAAGGDPVSPGQTIVA